MGYLIRRLASLLDLEIVILEISTSQFVIVVDVVVYHAAVIYTGAAWMLLRTTSSSKLCLLQILLLFQAIQVAGAFRILQRLISAQLVGTVILRSVVSMCHF